MRRRDRTNSCANGSMPDGMVKLAQEWWSAGAPAGLFNGAEFDLVGARNHRRFLARKWRDLRELLR